MCFFALFTIFSGVAVPSSFSIDPELTPILIGTPFSLAAAATFLTFSIDPIFPGLILTLETPASMLKSASL